MSLYIGNEEIKELFLGDMGIKEVYLGDELIYRRPGGYVYLELDTSENTD